MSGKKKYPLGRYLTRQLRELLGLSPGAQEKPTALRQAEMQALRDASSTQAAFEVGKPMIEWQKILNLETRSAIWSKKGKL